MKLDGKALRRLREHRGFSQSRLEANTGISRSRISKIENASIDVSPNDNMKLADALNVDLTELQVYSFADRLKRVAFEYNLSGAAIAAELEVPRATISRWIAGDTEPSEHQMWPILERLKSIKSSDLEDKPGLDRQSREEIEVPNSSASSIHPSSWIGLTDRKEQLAGIKATIPEVRIAIEALIHGLDHSGHNGGPPLDDRNEAIEILRDLHEKLGSILTAIDEDRLESDYGEGLLVEAVATGQRIKKNFKDNPLAFASATLIMTVFSSLGLPAYGTFGAGVAFHATKK
jgi:transcriptional regulator with XRE-family HTH domain